MSTAILIGYFVVGVIVYALLAKAIERSAGNAPQMGCFAWLLCVTLWPVWVLAWAFFFVRTQYRLRKGGS
jgi:hypothetical protein